MDWQTILGDPRVLGGAAIAVLVLLAAAWFWRQRRRRDPRQRLRAVALDLLEGIIVPDGDEGQLHVEFALLTPAGVMLLDLRDVDGHVFGSNAMQDWTVLSDQRRFTFANPQHAMFDRVAAVRRLLPGIEVEGLVTFGSRAKFSKGLPEHVTLLDTLIDELRANRGDPEAPGLREAWDKLRREAVSAQLGRLLKD